jgi:hypothetical protein
MAPALPLSESAEDERVTDILPPPDPGGFSVPLGSTTASYMPLETFAAGKHSSKVAGLQNDENEICVLFEKDSRYPLLKVILSVFSFH